MENCKLKRFVIKEGMRKSSHGHFAAALAYLVGKGGHGEQARVAKKASVSTVHLNDVLKGRKSASQEFQEKIATALGMAYEDMLSLGRWILDGGKPEVWPGMTVRDFATAGSVRPPPPPPSPWSEAFRIALLETENRALQAERDRERERADRLEAEARIKELEHLLETERKNAAAKTGNEPQRDCEERRSAAT